MFFAYKLFKCNSLVTPFPIIIMLMYIVNYILFCVDTVTIVDHRRQVR